MAAQPKPGQGSKMMSSRLATMKFMQRAAASPKNSPSTPEEPSKKRQRMSNGSYNSTPETTPNTEAQTVQAAVDMEESKRQEALERDGVAKGDTKWYLSMQRQPKPTESPLRIVSTGYSTLDNRAASEDEGVSAPGRLNFGNFKKKQYKPAAAPQVPASEESDSGSDSEEEEEDDDGDDPTGTKAMIRVAGAKARADRKAQKAREAGEAARLAELRRKKGVNLNKVTSISGAGKPGSSSAECFKCGEKGHLKVNCPQAAKGFKRKSY